MCTPCCHECSLFAWVSAGDTSFVEQVLLVQIEPRSHYCVFCEARLGQQSQRPFPERWHCHARARLEVPQEASMVQLLTQMQDEDSRHVPHHALPECTCTAWKHLDKIFLARLG